MEYAIICTLALALGAFMGYHARKGEALLLKDRLIPLIQSIRVTIQAAEHENYSDPFDLADDIDDDLEDVEDILGIEVNPWDDNDTTEWEAM